MGWKSTRVVPVVAVAVVTALTGAPAVTPASAASAHRDLTPGHYTIASFNVLGASHTKPGGKRASGATRIVYVNRLLNRHHVDVAGFQEMQPSQARKFLRITHGGWALYPGLDGQKKIDSENSVGWRTGTFELVQATTVKIPYFDGHTRRMPLVLLRQKRTGMMTYIANFHNPAETGKYRNQGRWRRAATKIEVALQNQIVTKGIPRIMTGDMNERAPYFCRVTKRAPLKAARPESYRRDGHCHAGRPRAVDWILGSIRIRFSNYDEDRSHLVDITTDHPVITTQVTVDPDALPNGWQVHPPAPIVPRLG
jgi:hypothetical protein